MVMYAYKDKERKVKVYARYALKEDKGRRFYCPNPLCPAEMYIVLKEGAAVAYFAGRGHLNDCSFYNKKNSYDPEKFNEEEFDFYNALMSLSNNGKTHSNKRTSKHHKTGAGDPKPLRTIRQIYDMCNWHDCYDTYNGVMVGQMLLNDDSAKMYTNGVEGWRLIEAKRKLPKFYDSENLEIHLISPVSQKKFTFVLNFADAILYREIKDWIYANRNYIFVVAGDWCSSNNSNVFSALISTKKQLTLIK